MTREEAYKTIKENLCAMCSYGSQCMESCDISSCDNKDAMKVLEQEPILDKIRKQIKSNLRGVEIALEVLVENHPLRQKMEGAKDTLEDCLELIDKAESEN